MSQTGIDVILDLSGPEGNAFSVVGAVSRVLRRVDRDLNDEYQDKVFKGNYENVLRISNEYVNLLDTSNSYRNILPPVEVEVKVRRI